MKIYQIKKAKKLLATVLTLSMMLLAISAVLPTVGAAAPTANCTVAVTEKNVGSADHYVTADVKFKSESEFTAGRFTVKAGNLTLTECSVANRVGGTAPEVQFEASTGKVIFTGFSNSSANDFTSYTSVTLTLKFESGSGAAQSAVRKVTVKNIELANIDEVKFVTADAEGTSISYTPGDINGDDKVNNKDLVRLFQYLSKWDVSVNADALDVNGDTKSNNKDLVRLFQYLSKWDVEIF